MDTQTKREREKRMVSQMIALYCRKKHRTRGGLCPQCAALDAYAKMRARSWKPRRSVPTAGYIATNRICAQKSAR